MQKNSVFKSEKGKTEILEFYDKILDKWPQKCRKQFIKTRYGFTFVIECGDKTKPPIILLHGSGSNAAMWSADVHKYSKNHRVFAIDIIGECGKSTESRPKFTDAHYSNWLLDIITELQISHATIIGCSLGGWIAIDFSIHHPEKINKLVLIATGGISQIKFSSILLIMITSVAGKWGFNKMNKMIYGNLNLDIQTLRFIQMVKKYFIPRTDILPLFSDKQLQTINKPVYFIGGENDCFYNPFKVSKRLKKNNIKSECKILKNTGHVITHSSNEIIPFLENNR